MLPHDKSSVKNSGPERSPIGRNSSVALPPSLLRRLLYVGGGPVQLRRSGWSIPVNFHYSHFMSEGPHVLGQPGDIAASPVQSKDQEIVPPEQDHQGVAETRDVPVADISSFNLPELDWVFSQEDDDESDIGQQNLGQNKVGSVGEGLTTKGIEVQARNTLSSPSFLGEKYPEEPSSQDLNNNRMDLKSQQVGKLKERILSGDSLNEKGIYPEKTSKVRSEEVTIPDGNVGSKPVLKVSQVDLPNQNLQTKPESNSPTIIDYNGKGQVSNAFQTTGDSQLSQDTTIARMAMHQPIANDQKSLMGSVQFNTSENRQSSVSTPKVQHEPSIIKRNITPMVNPSVSLVNSENVPAHEDATEKLQEVMSQWLVNLQSAQKSTTNTQVVEEVEQRESTQIVRYVTVQRYTQSPRRTRSAFWQRSYLPRLPISMR